MCRFNELIFSPGPGTQMPSPPTVWSDARTAVSVWHLPPACPLSAGHPEPRPDSAAVLAEPHREGPVPQTGAGPGGRAGRAADHAHQPGGCQGPAGDTAAAGPGGLLPQGEVQGSWQELLAGDRQDWVGTLSWWWEHGGTGRGAQLGVGLAGLDGSLQWRWDHMEPIGNPQLGLRRCRKGIHGSWLEPSPWSWRELLARMENMPVW